MSIVDWLSATQCWHRHHKPLLLLDRLATNLITYLRQEMGEAPAFSAIMVQLFEGTCYMTPLLGAWLADSHWGRYKTILVFSSIYMLVRRRRKHLAEGSPLQCVPVDEHLSNRPWWSSKCCFGALKIARSWKVIMQ